MKTNLTTKQVKKIQNGKLAIYKDIDTADAREYLFNVLDWLFPKDPSSISAKKTEIREYVYLHLSKDISNFWHGTLNNANIPTLPLSRIMYTYNPEQFKPISTPCTEEQWNNDLKPVVEAFGIDCECCSDWNEKFNFLQNNYCGNHECIIGNFDNETKTINHYSPTEFLEACGIVRADKRQNDENLDCLRFTFDLSSLYNRNDTHTITTDQIKNARTNPETLEELFPKVFEKPVVEVGKWYVFEEYSKRIVKFVEKENKTDYSGYGFNADGEFSTNDFCSKKVTWEITEATLSDLQPLFKSLFSTMYKEGDLLGSPHSGAEFEYRAKDVEYDQLLSNVSYIGHFCIFKNGNFAKVIKSAALIKAEEELEQAKKKVERLTNK